MTLPPDAPILRFIFWLVNTPGLGGLGVAAIIAGCLTTFAAALRWIAAGAHAAEPSVYPYPTPALHDHES